MKAVGKLLLQGAKNGPIPTSSTAVEVGGVL